MAEEVGNIGRSRRLSPEAHAKLPVPQPTPELSLLVGHVLSQLARVFEYPPFQLPLVHVDSPGVARTTTEAPANSHLRRPPGEVAAAAGGGPGRRALFSRTPTRLASSPPSPGGRRRVL